jgi:hypothetical protein
MRAYPRIRAVAIRKVERPISKPFRRSHRETTVLELLAVALRCHSEQSEESLILFALFVLAFCSLPGGPAFDLEFWVPQSSVLEGWGF